MTTSPILTLEPLIDAVRSGVESVGWELSGLQKTTSHQFEGRWDGESTRSAYLFFHAEDGPEWVSVDVYLDETSRGVTGNLALVADLQSLGRLAPAHSLMAFLSEVADRHIDARHRRPLTLRFRMADAGGRVDDAETEVRFKVRIPGRALREGMTAVEAFAVDTMGAFGRILASSDLQDRALKDVAED